MDRQHRDNRVDWGNRTAGGDGMDRQHRDNRVDRQHGSSRRNRLDWQYGTTRRDRVDGIDRTAGIDWLDGGDRTSGDDRTNWSRVVEHLQRAFVGVVVERVNWNAWCYRVCVFEKSKCRVDPIEPGDVHCVGGQHNPGGNFRGDCHYVDW